MEPKEPRCQETDRKIVGEKIENADEGARIPGEITCKHVLRHFLAVGFSPGVGQADGMASRGWSMVCGDGATLVKGNQGLVTVASRPAALPPFVLTPHHANRKKPTRDAHEEQRDDCYDGFIAEGGGRHEDFRLERSGLQFPTSGLETRYARKR